MRRMSSWALAAALSLAIAEAPAAQPNATVRNGNVHLRASYPTYSAFTLVRFKLDPGRSIAVLEEGTRITVSSRRVIASQEWFEATTVTGADGLRGWIYAGEVGQRTYVELDKGVELALRTTTRASAPGSGGVLLRLGEGLLPARLEAQEHAVVQEPPIQTSPVMTLMLGAANVGIFMGALYLFRRWFPGSNLYPFMYSLSVLLMLGFISEKSWRDTIASWLRHQ